ncbi:MAG: methyl-accepting chemotaxis protein, partial [Thermodesulfobacteriota bacterium]|nr:methyl-accepting chemotaxis protein [Thermodesulfobacteriota bacterium]
AGSLSLIIFFMFAVTWYTTSAQKADGLIINLAGRQRMLSQKMTKEILLLIATDTKEAKTYQSLSDTIKNTITVFDTTLTALIDSGKAPLTFDLNGEHGECPEADEPVASQLKIVKNIWVKFSEKLDNIINNNDKTGESLKFIKSNNLNLLTEMNRAVGMMQKQSEEKVSLLILLQTIGIIAGIILMGLSISTIRTIVAKLMHSAAAAKQMSSGDLTRRFKTREGSKLDEIEFLGQNLNTFMNFLQKEVKGISTNAADLENSSTNMHAIAQQLSKESKESALKTQAVSENAVNMSEDMNAVAAAMEELSSNTQEIAHSTSRISSTSKQISQNTKRANEISADAVKVVNTASSRVEDLGNAAKKIEHVSQSITEISEQTNLLALNATIEAARAGEAGKGFAVVASEIKNLANQTTEATEQIKQNIDGIQNSTKFTVEDISDISNVINQVSDIIKTIATAIEEQESTIEEININVAQGAEAVQEVSANAANSSTAASEIAKDINSLNDVINGVSSNSSQIKANSEDLSTLAAKLSKMVASFTIT